MARLTEAVRVTTREQAIWRECAACGLLAAMPPEVDRCDACQPAAEDRRRDGGRR